MVLCGAAKAERQGSVGLGHTAGKRRRREENTYNEKKRERTMTKKVRLRND